MTVRANPVRKLRAAASSAKASVVDIWFERWYDEVLQKRFGIRVGRNLGIDADIGQPRLHLGAPLWIGRPVLIERRRHAA